jgi:hypothetical protein
VRPNGPPHLSPRLWTFARFFLGLGDLPAGETLFHDHRLQAAPAGVDARRKARRPPADDGQS